MTEQAKITKRDINQCWGPYSALYYFADVLNLEKSVDDLRKEILEFIQEVSK